MTPGTTRAATRARMLLSIWNTKCDKNRNHEVCERGSDRATLGLENLCVGARESLCWDDRTALVFEYRCVLRRPHRVGACSIAVLRQPHRVGGVRDSPHRHSLSMTRTACCRDREFPSLVPRKPMGTLVVPTGDRNIV